MAEPSAVNRQQTAKRRLAHKMPARMRLCKTNQKYIKFNYINNLIIHLKRLFNCATRRTGLGAWPPRWPLRRTTNVRKKKETNKQINNRLMSSATVATGRSVGRSVCQWDDTNYIVHFMQSHKFNRSFWPNGLSPEMFQSDR